VLYVGASNYSAWQLGRALSVSERNRWARFDSLQPHYSLVHRAEFERELLPLCEAEGIGVIPYSPLGGGFLTGKYQRDRQAPNSVRAEGIGNRYGKSERAWSTLAAVEKLARDSKRSPVEVSLAWLLTQRVISATIIGANSVDQLDDSLAAAGYRLSAEEMDMLTAVSGGAFNWNDE